LMKVGYILMVSVLFVITYLFLFTTGEEHVFAEFRHEGQVAVSIIVGSAILVAYVVGLVMPRISALSKLGTFFGDRMYLPFLNDYIVPKLGFSISDLVQNYGNRGIDGFFNTRVIPGMFGGISRVIRSIQNGHLSRYVNIVLGVVMAILVLVSIGGVLL
jgi:NADH:ubiquinone oxidoreductase subunit 5 (subunit L)/multisubunit Na+/H+ antiporter MnhA subunit